MQSASEGQGVRSSITRDSASSLRATRCEVESPDFLKRGRTPADPPVTAHGCTELAYSTSCSTSLTSSSPAVLCALLSDHQRNGFRRRCPDTEASGGNAAA